MYQDTSISAHSKSARQGVPHVPEGMDARFLTSILDASPDCIKVLTLEGEIIYMNLNGMCAMEIDDFDMIGGQSWESLWPVEMRAAVREAVERAGQGETQRFTGSCPTAKGADRMWDVWVAPIRNKDGSIDTLLSMSRDITAHH